MHKKGISLVIPAYNEEDRILDTAEAYYKYLSRNFTKYELIIACNNCSDNTPKIAENFCRGKKAVFLNFPYYTGKGGAVIEGFRKAKNELAAFVDADNSTTPEEFDKLVRNADNCKVIIASRALSSSILKTKQPFPRRFLGMCFRSLVNILFSLNIKDTQCGAKIFPKKALAAVLPTLKSSGFAFDVEILWKLKKKGFSILEVPIAWNDSGRSSVSFSDPFKMFSSIIALRFSKS